MIKILINNSNIDSFCKEYSRQFMRKSSFLARSVVTYLNLSMSVEDFCDVCHTFKKSDYSSFLRIYNDVEQN